MKYLRVLLNLLAFLVLLLGMLFRFLHWPGSNEWFIAGLLLIGSTYAIRMIQKEPDVQLSHNKGQLNLGGRVLILMAVLMLVLQMPYSLILLLAGLVLIAIAYFLDGPDDPTHTLHDRIEELGQGKS